MKKLLIKILTLIVALSTAFAITFAFTGCGEGEGGEGGDGNLPETGVLGDNGEALTLTLSAGQMQLVVGDEQFLSSAVSQIPTQKLTFVSNNPSVASVASNGKITAENEGTAKITATYVVNANKSLTADCTVNVGFGTTLPVLKFKNAPISNSYDLGVNDVYTFEPYILFNNKEFYDLTIEYTSHDETVAQFLNDNPNKLKALKKGEVELSFKATWRGKTFETAPSLFSTTILNVKDYFEFYLNGDVDSYFKLYTSANFAGANYTKQMTLNPSFFFNGEKIAEGVSNLSVVSSDEEILEVNGNNITALTAGIATLTLSYTHNGENYSKEIEVDVVRPRAQFENYVNDKGYFDYYSSLLGIVKVDNGEGTYVNKTINQVIWGDDADDIFDVYQVINGEEKLIYSNGKHVLLRDTDFDYDDRYESYRNRIFDVQVPNDKPEIVTLVVGTKTETYEVDFMGYGAVISESVDLSVFNVDCIYTDIINDDPADAENYHKLDRYPFVYGYSVLLNDVNFDYNTYNRNPDINRVVNKNVQNNSSSSQLMWQSKLFGFAGTLDGQGYAIINLHSNTGFLAFTAGGSLIKNVMFKNIYTTNSFGYTLMYNAYGCEKLTSKNGYFTAGTPTFKDCYFEIGETEYYYGAFGRASGFKLENIIIDATKVSENQKITKYGAFFDGLKGLTGRSPTGINTNNVYVISKLPLAVDGSKRLYGENELPNGYSLETAYTNGDYTEYYATGVKRYASLEAMAQDQDNDYSVFASNSCWYVGDVPYWRAVAKSNDIVIPYIDGQEISQNKVSINAGKEHSIELKTFNTGVKMTEGILYESTNVNLVNIHSATGKFTPASVRSNQEVEIIACYIDEKGVQQQIVITLELLPFIIEIDDEVSISSKDGSNTIDDVLGFSVYGPTATQVINNQIYELVSTTNGNVAGGQVVIKPDRSDVETSKVTIVEESGKTYIFNNAKVYSHIIDEYNDLEVFALTDKSAIIGGFYVMVDDIANLNDSGDYIFYDKSIENNYVPVSNHSKDVLNPNVAPTYLYVGNLGPYVQFVDDIGYFNGVFDGRGHTITNFIPSEYGLFGALGADENGAAAIRNVGFERANFGFKGYGNGGHGATLLAYQAKTGDKNNQIEITNLHVEVGPNYFISPGFPVYQGLIGIVNDKANVKLTNVFVDYQGYQDVDYSKQYYARPIGSIFANDGILTNVRTTENYDIRDTRYDNVIVLSKLILTYYRVGSSRNNGSFYTVYGENRVGLEGFTGRKIGGSAIEGQIIDPEVIDGDKFSGCYVAHGVKQYVNIEEMRTAIKNNEDPVQSYLNKFLATGLWELKTTTIGEGDNATTNIDLVWKNNTLTQA